MGGWLSDDWFNVIGAIGIVGSLLFTGTQIRDDLKTRRVSNLLTAIQNHRELWQDYSTRPSIARVLDPEADLNLKPITREEELFVNCVILHVSGVYYALKEDLYVEQEGFRRDICSFFTLPIPKAVWEEAKILQNTDFAEFVKQCQD